MSAHHSIAVSLALLSLYSQRICCRVHFVPISQFYGVLNNSQGKTPADVHGGYLLEEGNWTSEDWTSFYVTCIHCIRITRQGSCFLQRLCLHDRQLLAAASHDGPWQIMPGFIEEVVRSGGVCERDQVMNLYQTNQTWSVTPIGVPHGRPVASRTLLRGWDIRSIQDVQKPLTAEGQWRDEGLLRTG